MLLSRRSALLGTAALASFAAPLAVARRKTIEDRVNEIIAELRSEVGPTHENHTFIAELRSDVPATDENRRRFLVLSDVLEFINVLGRGASS